MPVPVQLFYARAPVHHAARATRSSFCSAPTVSGAICSRASSTAAASACRSASIGVAISFTIGTLVGSIAGYIGGWVDNLIMRLVEVEMSLPSFYFLLALASVIPAELLARRRPSC